MTNAFATTDRSLYGATEVNGLVDGHAYHAQVDYSRFYSLAQVKELGGKITRVRVLTEGPFRDVSYINATLPNGEIVNVSVGVNNMTHRSKFKGELIAWAAREGVFAKGIGLLDEGNWSVLY